MKALSLTQPWASLIFDGRKRIETRSWGTNYRGLLAIHAAKKIDEEACREAGFLLSDVVRGAVLGVVDLYRCERMTEKLIAEVDVLERSWGDYEVGRYAWFLRAPVGYPTPLAARGNRLLWEWTPPPLPDHGEVRG